MFIGTIGACSDIGVLALAEGCRQLKVLGICDPSSNSDISDLSIIKITESCTLLENLTLSCLRQVTDESCFAIERNCKHLKLLELYELSGIESEVGLKTLFSSPNLKGLTRVDVENIPVFTDDVLLELVKNLHGTLTSLGLGGYDSMDVTDAGMYHISQYCRKLEEFTITYLHYISLPTYIAEIIRCNPRLVTFSFHSDIGENRIKKKDTLAPMIEDALEKNIKLMKGK